MGPMMDGRGWVPAVGPWGVSVGVRVMIVRASPSACLLAAVSIHLHHSVPSPTLCSFSPVHIKKTKVIMMMALCMLT